MMILNCQQFPCYSSHNVMQLFKLRNSNIDPLFKTRIFLPTMSHWLRVSSTSQYNLTRNVLKCALKKRRAGLPLTAFHFNTLEWHQPSAAAQHPCVFHHHQCVCVFYVSPYHVVEEVLFPRSTCSRPPLQLSRRRAYFSV